MTDNAQGRMLLSHNFALPEGEVHSLNREDFAAVFIQGLSDTAGIECMPIDNPHWVVEVSYNPAQHTPTAVGQKCADTLTAYRQKNSEKDFTIMALGGVKNTPATSAPPALQTGEWGVDVVETRQPDEFLEEINWDKLAGAKPTEDIFKISCSV